MHFVTNLDATERGGSSYLQNVSDYMQDYLLTYSMVQSPS